MKTYWRILRYVRNYWFHLGASLTSILFFTLFSSASLVAIIPLLQVIFRAGRIQGDAGLPQVAPAAGNELVQTIERWRAAAEEWLLSGGQVDALEKVCIMIVVLIVLKGLFGYLQAYFMAYVEQAVMRDIRNDLYRHINRLSLPFFNRTRTGQLISHITNDVNLVNNGVSATFVTLIKNPLLIFANLGLAFYLSWQLTLAALVILPVSSVIIGGIGLRLRKASTRSQEKMADVTSILQESIAGMRIVKAFAMEQFEIRRFMRETEAYFRTLLRITRVRNLASPITESLGALVGVGILWVGGKQVIAGSILGPEEFIAFLVLIFSLMQPLKELSSVTTRLNEALAAGDRIFALLDTEPDIVEKPGAVELVAFEKEIVFDNVNFAYEKGKPVLQDISFRVDKGQILALVGPSGGGKSTLVDLIPRFYEPDSGTITIDGTDIREVTLASLRGLMGIVTQETILFNDTIRNNIAYGLADVDDARVEEAARVANAHRFIRTMSEGYDTMIGERGVKLSGGQRQRIAIARAVLKNPPILILDEATSALDTESELLVQEAIERLMQNRTTFVIAHRLSTILHADQILVISSGRIVERGTHEQLLGLDGTYKNLYNMQFRA
ncbi:MAG TPA: ABC transporter ATP-binding protein [Bacteroidetes bacterium]|nr:ABC transporter ATP-binding protein [Bacteroidota bacterium]